MQSLCLSLGLAHSQSLFLSTQTQILEAESRAALKDGELGRTEWFPVCATAFVTYWIEGAGAGAGLDNISSLTIVLNRLEMTHFVFAV